MPNWKSVNTKDSVYYRFCPVCANDEPVMVGGGINSFTGTARLVCLLSIEHMSSRSSSGDGAPNHGCVHAVKTVIVVKHNSGCSLMK